MDTLFEAHPIHPPPRVGAAKDATFKCVFLITMDSRSTESADYFMWLRDLTFIQPPVFPSLYPQYNTQYSIYSRFFKLLKISLIFALSELVLSAFSRIQSKFGKIRTRITQSTNTFHAVFIELENTNNSDVSDVILV